MIPIELEIRNFLAYRDPGVLRFDGMHVACLAGPNGAGKSSLLDAITWALWGKARGNSPDELIHQGESEMRVALTFDHGASRLRAIRQRKGGKRGVSLLDLQRWDPEMQAWRSLSEASMRETQAKIEALLRLDYETFVNSAFLMQGRADEFTTKIPSQRKQVLANILGLAQWEVYEERAKERLVGIRAEMQRLEGRLEEIDRELARREEVEAELAASQAAAQEVAERLASAERHWADLEQTRGEMVSLQRQIDDLTRRITTAERDLAEAEDERQRGLAQADEGALRAALEQLRSQLAERESQRLRAEAMSQELMSVATEAANLQGMNQALGPETEPLKARAETLSAAPSPICPTCGQPLSEEHRAQLLDELEREIEARRERYRSNLGRMKELQTYQSAHESELSELTRQLSQTAPLEKRAAELEIALAHAGQAAELAASAQKKIKRWRKALASDQAQRAQLEAQAATVERRLQEAALTQSDLDQLRLEKRLADERVGGARQKLATLDSLAQQRQDRLKERQRMADDLSLFEDLRLAFGKRGVPAMIIETAVPEIERAANDLLTRMTDGRMNVRIETQKETKSGELREALDIIISDELGSRPYEMFSGGEAFRIDFAIRIALSRLLARRAGAQLRSLFIDEGFGTQDARGREFLVAAINSIQDDFDRILVITHIDELKDAFPARIEVEKGPHGSQFSLS
ncbi:MAG TPA: SMC family ATPase [Anaerolineales bacterium]|nr:SMC family ATPase [Anaerolineales bacterium]